MLAVLYLCVCAITGMLLLAICVPDVRRLYLACAPSLKAIENIPSTLFVVSAGTVTGMMIVPFVHYFVILALSYFVASDKLCMKIGFMVTAALFFWLVLTCLIVVNKRRIKKEENPEEEAVTKLPSYVNKPSNALFYSFVILAVTVTAAFLMFYTYRIDRGYLLNGYSTFSDLSPHTAMVSSFGIGFNFPTEYMHFSGDGIKYHFMFYFLAGMLQYLGFPIDYALNIPSIIVMVCAMILLGLLATLLSGRRLAFALSPVLVFFRSSLNVFIHIRDLMGSGKTLGDALTEIMYSNEWYGEPLRDLAEQGCDIIFFNGYSELVMKLAPEYPDIQFCQTSYMDMNGVEVPDNYHTFKGEAYQARYVSGIAAGMKIKQMISEGVITQDQAQVGFVAAFPTSEVISGYTAFLLGVRYVVPSATMRVCYTYTWSSYAQEISAARRLIEEGCVILSQHTDTIGPAIACEEMAETRPVYFVGYNKSMSEVAPAASLVTARVCWEPYVTAAVDAVMSDEKIETVVSGRVHGNGHDMSAGFDYGWVEMDDLNLQVAAPGTTETMNKAIEQFHRGNDDFVFRGNYLGVNPEDPSDTMDLRNGYIENETTSYPLFHYILSDVITVMK